LINKVGEPTIVARASYLSGDAAAIERFIKLALPAAKEALAPLAGLVGNFQTIPVILGLPAERPGIPGGFGSQLAERFQDLEEGSSRISSLEMIPHGHAAGLMALEAGYRKIQNGSFDFCLVGGIDSYLEPETLEWLEEGDQLHSSNNPWGFVPGEAAGFCLLTSCRFAERYNLPVLGRVLAVSTAYEKNLIKTGAVCTGKGLSEVVQKVLPALPAPDARVDQTICDLNGEPYRADEFGFTAARTSERFVAATEFLAPADCWGDVGAASGPLFVSLAAAASLKGYAKGPHTLIWTSSEGGERTAALLRSEVRPRVAPL
jgi:3-oxoacyl-[acyl-carrier-protein] synthase-1